VTDAAKPTHGAVPADDEAFATTARSLLDAGDASLDSEVGRRLAAARRAAVAALTATPVAHAARWIPASAAAGTLLAVALFAWSVRIPALPYYDDEQAALAAQELELLDEIEFVAWMAAEVGGDAA
jgi:hypothetical protein